MPGLLHHPLFNWIIYYLLKRVYQEASINESESWQYRSFTLGRKPPETCTFEISYGHNPEPQSVKIRSRYLIVTERKLFIPLYSQFFNHFNLKRIWTIRASVWIIQVKVAVLYLHVDP
jgi:hypothetical protein